MKSQLREDILKKLRQLSQEAKKKEVQEENLHHQLFKTPEWQQAKVVGLTLSMPVECDTSRVIEQAFLEEKQVVLPKTKSGGQMDFFDYTKDTLIVKTSFGVYEPVSEIKVDKSDIDLMIVPGVCFSESGYRIGFGGGFYDRYLVDYEGETLSLVLPAQLVDQLEPEEHDIPVKKILKYGE